MRLGWSSGNRIKAFSLDLAMFWRITHLMMLLLPLVLHRGSSSTDQFCSLSPLFYTGSNFSTRLLLIQGCHLPAYVNDTTDVRGLSRPFPDLSYAIPSWCLPLPWLSSPSFLLFSQFHRRMAWTTVSCQTSHREIWWYNWIVWFSFRFWWRVSSPTQR